MSNTVHTADRAKPTAADIDLLRKLENGSRGRGQLPKGYLRLRRMGWITQSGTGFYGWIVVVSDAGRALYARATGETP